MTLRGAASRQRCWLKPISPKERPPIKLRPCPNLQLTWSPPSAGTGVDAAWAGLAMLTLHQWGRLSCGQTPGLCEALLDRNENGLSKTAKAPPKPSALLHSPSPLGAPHKPAHHQQEWKYDCVRNLAEDLAMLEQVLSTDLRGRLLEYKQQGPFATPIPAVPS